MPYSIYGHACIQDVIEWSIEGDAELIDNGDGTVEISFPSAGTVTLMAVLDSDCGEVSDVLEITVGPEAVLDLGPDFGMCTGSAIPELDAGEAYDFYLWTTGETSQTIQAGMPGIYGVTVENEFCQAYDEVEITEEFVTGIDLGPDLEICDGSIAVIDAGDGYNDYVWQDGTTGPQYTIYEGGTYWVTATIPCLASDTLEVDDCGQVITGVDEWGWIESMALFPNPNDGQFRVTFGMPVALSRWTLVSAEGRRVAGNEINSKVTELSIAEDLAAGTYVLSLEGEQGTVRKRVVIK